MEKQLKILKKEITIIKKTEPVNGILLTGSVACGTALETSDLDLIILSNRDSFVTKMVDNILVEITYLTFEKAKQKLLNNPMDVYHYLDSKIIYDNGQLSQLMDEAQEIYQHYQTPNTVKRSIYHWLKSTHIKIETAFGTGNKLLLNYYMSTNMWKILEGVWAVNNKPMPPSSTVFRRYSSLKIIPCLGWFENLFTGNSKQRYEAVLQIIDWLLPMLEQA